MFVEESARVGQKVVIETKACVMVGGKKESDIVPTKRSVLEESGDYRRQITSDGRCGTGACSRWSTDDNNAAADTHSIVLGVMGDHFAFVSMKL